MLGCLIGCTLGGAMWPPTPLYGWTCETNSPHLTEWEAQKSQACSLNDLECDTEVIYRARLIKRQDDKDIANSREAASKQLPPEQQAAHAERQAQATPTNPDAAPVRMQAALYPNWVWARVTKPQSSDPPRPYRTPRQDARQGSFR